MDGPGSYQIYCKYNGFGLHIIKMGFYISGRMPGLIRKIRLSGNAAGYLNG